MFDFAGYAREKGIAIAIDPYGEHTLLTVSPSVEMGKDYTKLECCVRAGLVEPDQGITETGRNGEVLEKPMIKAVKYLYTVFFSAIIACLLFCAFTKTELPVDNNALFVGACILSAVQNRF